MKVVIPDWWAVNDKVANRQKLTSLEEFVLHNEPAGEEAEATFRTQLAAALEEVWWLGKED